MWIVFCLVAMCGAGAEVVQGCKDYASMSCCRTWNVGQVVVMGKNGVLGMHLLCLDVGGMMVQKLAVWRPW